MMRYWSVILLVWIGQLCAQSTYSFLPDIGSEDGRSAFYTVLPDSNEFFILGEYFDSSLVGHQLGVNPFLASFDYDGMLKHINTIVDSAYFSPVGFTNAVFVPSKDGNLYAIASRFSEAPPSIRYVSLLKLNRYNGKVLKSTVFVNPQDSTANLSKGSIWYNNDNTIILGNSFIDTTLSQVDIIELDTNFNVLNRIITGRDDKAELGIYCGKNNRGNYEVIGTTSTYTPQIEFIKAGLLYIEVQPDKEMLQYNYTDDGNNYYFILNRDVIKTSDGIWVLAPQAVRFFPPGNSSSAVPITMSLSKTLISSTGKPNSVTFHG